MRLFSEKVSPTLTDSPLNIIKVQDFSEIFFGVYEVEINKNKYPVEKISEHNGNPVVSIPVEMGGKIANYPFVLTKGKFEVVFNEQSDYVEIFESKIEDSIEEESITITENDEIFIPEVVEDQKNEILLQIQEAKKNALIAAKKELELKKSRQIKQIREESETKKKALESYLESARENLVDEFTIISQRIKKEVFDNNDEKYSEIRETIDNKIEEIRDSLDESLKKDFSKSSQLIDKSIKQLVKDLWEKNINPKVDKELRDIAVEIHEKVSEIDNNLNSKLDKKADRSLLEGVDKEISAIRDANIELNNSLNKGVQKALSRVGNVDKKVIQISEEFERKLDEKEREVVSYFDDKLELVKEETLDITDEARKYFQNLIQESRDGLLTEIRKIKAEKPVEYILETKKSGKIVKDWDSIEKEWNTKIHDKIENVKTDLRKYVTVYASGGGTNATQYQDGGTMNGDLTVVGAISANQYLGLSYLLNDYLPLSGGTVTGNLTVDTNTLFVDAANNRVGVGTTSPSARLHTISTAEQLRVGYDDSNYFSATVDATGAVTLNAVGSGAIFNFSDNVSAANLVYNTGDQSIAGDKTFTDDVIVNGQITSPNQTASMGESVITKRLGDLLYTQAFGSWSIRIDQNTGWNAANSGSGAASSYSSNTLTCNTSTVSGNRASIYSGGYSPFTYCPPGGFHASNGNSGIYFDRELVLGFRITHTYGSNQSIAANAEGYVRFGGNRGNATFEPLTEAGIGVFIFNRELYGMVHNGTTLNQTTLPLYSMAGWPYPVNYIEIYSDGLGNVSFYNNRTLIETISGGPTVKTGTAGTQTYVGCRTNENLNLSLFIPQGLTLTYL